MEWNQRWAGRAAQMKRSAVRELLKLTARPDVISFAGGLPAPELFPVGEIEAATTAVLRERPAAALQYGETEGVGELRDWVAARYSTAARPLSRNHVLITSGAQQGLDLIGRVLLDPGDRVAVEDPTYLALLSAWRPLGVRFEAMAMGDSRSSSLRGKGAKLAYVVPNFQNPTGLTLGDEARQKLLARLRSWDAVCLEDDPYGELRYSGTASPSLFEREASSGDPGWRVIRTGTFSKVLMPGLRVGWVLAPEAVVDRLVCAKQAVDLHTSTFTQHLVLELLRRGVLEPQLERLVAEYRRRRDAMLAAMAASFPPEIVWTRPDGGMFVFVTLPGHWDAAELLARSLDLGVAFVPGAEFHLGEGGRNTLRLNFTNATPARIEEGISRPGEVMGEEHLKAHESEGRAPRILV